MRSSDDIVEEDILNDDPFFPHSNECDVVFNLYCECWRAGDACCRETFIWLKDRYDQARRKCGCREIHRA